MWEFPQHNLIENYGGWLIASLVILIWWRHKRIKQDDKLIFLKTNAHLFLAKCFLVICIVSIFCTLFFIWQSDKIVTVFLRNSKNMSGDMYDFLVMKYQNYSNFLPYTFSAGIFLLPLTAIPLWWDKTVVAKSRSIIIECAKCKQKLRVPKYKTIDVNCPKCKTNFRNYGER